MEDEQSYDLGAFQARIEYVIKEVWPTCATQQGRQWQI